MSPSGSCAWGSQGALHGAPAPGPGSATPIGQEPRSMGAAGAVPVDGEAHSATWPRLRVGAGAGTCCCFRELPEQQCCGATGPLDWVNHTSTFRSFYPEGLAPWPFLCCKRDANFVILSPEGCRVGHVDYINTKGCFEHIENAVNSYTWGISWFGFAILMFTCPVMLLAMYHYTTL